MVLQYGIKTLLLKRFFISNYLTFSLVDIDGYVTKFNTKLSHLTQDKDTSIKE